MVSPSLGGRGLFASLSVRGDGRRGRKKPCLSVFSEYLENDHRKLFEAGGRLSPMQATGLSTKQHGDPARLLASLRGLLLPARLWPVTRAERSILYLFPNISSNNSKCIDDMFRSANVTGGRSAMSLSWVGPVYGVGSYSNSSPCQQHIQQWGLSGRREQQQLSNGAAKAAGCFPANVDDAIIQPNHRLFPSLPSVPPHALSVLPSTVAFM
ncbi:hypothetical protein SK128_016048 [Halocaridina rubra]|uniref:Uncharacterized protein n=1 Tax=Halocaridina rubra TaxID=373956 RepID=A0AAN9A0B4_HALRR